MFDVYVFVRWHIIGVHHFMNMRFGSKLFAVIPKFDPVYPESLPWLNVHLPIPGLSRMTSFTQCSFAHSLDILNDIVLVLSQ